MSDIKLKPCPSCGHRQPALLGYGDTYYVECVHCYLCGPRFDYDKDAAEAWNALPRHLHWTTETPTEPGWYWCRSNVQPFELDEALIEAAPLRFQWAGPIPEPEEAKQ